MASIDDIFKNSGVSTKRRLEQPIRDPTQVYKTSKLRETASQRRAHVQDARDDADHDEKTADADADFGPDLPPGHDADDDDEEGRFFGGGISSKEAEILDFIDDADDGSAAKIDAAWLRKTALNLEKLSARNAELRAKFADEPHKFIASEADLDAEIMRLSVLSQHTGLFPDFARLGCAPILAGLLAHDNTDIAIDALTVINELTDEDTDAPDDHWDPLVDALLDSDLLGLLVSNLSRLDEADEADRNGVYYALGILENLCSRPAAAARIGDEDRLLAWLLQRIQRIEENDNNNNNNNENENGDDSDISQNRQYAAEVLALLAQASAENRGRLAAMDAVDLLLQLAAPYRRRDPAPRSNEEEFAENVFEVLTCLVDEPAAKADFLAAEGTELCLLMLKEAKMARGPALRLLDHAVGGPAGAPVCLRVVREGGLKPLFTLFARSADPALHGPLLAVFAAMLRFLPADSPERIRLLAKFVEKDYAKIAKLFLLRWDLVHRIRAAEAAPNPAEENDEEDAELALLSRRIDAGLFKLELIDVILAWLVAEDAGAARRITALLADRDEDLASLRRTLQGKLDALDPTGDDNQDTGDMLSTLMDFL